MKFLIAIFIIVSLAAGGFLLKGYFDQNAEADTLQSQIQSDTNNLKVLTGSNQSLTAEIEELKAKQVEVQKSLEAESTVVPAQMNSNEIVRNLLEAGQKYNVAVTPLTATDWTTTPVLKGSYWVYKATMKLNGTQSNLVAFLKYIQDTIYSTLVIESLDVTQTVTSPTATPTKTPTPTKTATPTPTPIIIQANLGIAIYTK